MIKAIINNFDVKGRAMALHSPYDDIYSDSYYDDCDTWAADGDDLDGDRI